MKNKAVVRMIIGLFVIAGLFMLYRWIDKITADPDFGSMDTSGMVAAVEYLPEGGSRIVMFDADGTKTESPNYNEGASDLDPVWRPDGQRVFFISDRKKGSNDIYRWNPATGAVDIRYESDRSAGSPMFGPEGWPDVKNSALITLGGNVFTFNQSLMSTVQTLPPTEFQGAGGEQENVGDAIKVAYERVGESFKKAVWGRDRKFIYAVMRRESDEVFVICVLEAMGEIQPMPIPVVAGQSIQFDVSSEGKAVVSVQGFEFVDPTQVPPEMLRDGKAYKPFRHAVYVIDVGEDGKIPQPVLLFTDQADLGIQPADLTPELRAQYKVPAAVNGVLVQNIAPGGAAEEMGIKVGDVVTSLNGKPTKDINELFTGIASVMLGVKTTFGVQTAGTARDVVYTFGNEDSMALRDPAFAPDGQSVAMTMGRVSRRFDYTPMRLVIVPIQGGVGAGRILIEGQIQDPSWSPDGSMIAYAKIGPAGDSQIFLIGADGSGERNLSGPGDFGKPKFSPMKKSSS